MTPLSASLHILQKYRRRLYVWLTLNGRIRVVIPWALALGPVAFVIAIVTPYHLFFYIAYVYLLLIAAGYMWVRIIGPRITVQRKLHSEWAQVGDELLEQWEVRNEAQIPLIWLELNDASTLPGYSGRRVTHAGIRNRNEWQTSAWCEKRGVYTLGPLTARLGDPFGLFEYAWQQEETHQIVVYPPLVQLPQFVLPQGQRGGLARADLLQQHITPSVGGLREYVQGDMPSRIHWPTVAKTQRLMVKEFDQERAGTLWIVLDLCTAAYKHMLDEPIDQAAQEPRYTQSSILEETSQVSRINSPLELAIVLVCSLTAQALSEGRSVGLLADDGTRHMVMPDQGPRQLWRILSELVDVQATGTLSLGEVLRQSHNARSSEVASAAIIVVTPTLDGAWLPALVTLTRGQPGGALALLVEGQDASTQSLIQRLAASGILAYPFTVGTPLQLLHPPKQHTAMRMSPLGRVMREA